MIGLQLKQKSMPEPRDLLSGKRSFLEILELGWLSIHGVIKQIIACDKGHVIYCIDGEMTTELKDGRKITLRKGMSYIVGDGSQAHKTFTDKGARLFIVD
ncbi:MAG: DHCW motif cupin fold protein [Ignavibacteriales bacterium]|nr:DHCW motif cupin fold protein [Ignavibacteriales bacterium]